MIAIQFDAAAVFTALDHARAALDDMTPVYQDIAEYMLEATKDRFRTGTAPDGTRWRDRSPTTLAAYLRRGDGDRPRPLIGPSGRLSNEIATIATADSAEVGSSLIYSGVMQDGVTKGAFGRSSRGGPLPWGDIPARPFLGISLADETAIIDIVDEHLEPTGTP